MQQRGGGGAGVIICCLPYPLDYFTTHLFRDGAPFLLLYANASAPRPFSLGTTPSCPRHIAVTDGKGYIDNTDGIRHVQMEQRGRGVEKGVNMLIPGNTVGPLLAPDIAVTDGVGF